MSLLKCHLVGQSTPLSGEGGKTQKTSGIAPVVQSGRDHQTCTQITKIASQQIIRAIWAERSIHKITAHWKGSEKLTSGSGGEFGWSVHGSQFTAQAEVSTFSRFWGLPVKDHKVKTQQCPWRDRERDAKRRRRRGGGSRDPKVRWGPVTSASMPRGCFWYHAGRVERAWKIPCVALLKTREFLRSRQRACPQSLYFSESIPRMEGLKKLRLCSVSTTSQLSSIAVPLNTLWQLSFVA